MLPLPNYPVGSLELRYNSKPMKPCKKRPHFCFQLTAIFLSLLLVVSHSTVDAAPSSTQARDPFQSASRISIPEAFGRIEESSAGTSGKTIIYIQDAHDSLEAQESIAKIIDHFVEHYGVKTVFEEGYEGPVPTDRYFSFVKNPILKEKISYFLMDKLRLGGAEYAHVNRKKDFRLIGADSIKLHLENIKQYWESAKRKTETQKDLNEIGSEIRRLADQHFPKELKEWMKLKERLDEGKLELLTYLKRLSASVPLLTVPTYINRLTQVENGKDRQAIEAIKEIDPKILFQEIDLLENALAEHHLRNGRDQKIFQHYKSLGLLKRLNDIQLSPEEYETVKSRLHELKTESFARSIVEITGKSIVLSRRWERNIQNAIRFYEIAEKRDQMAAKSLDGFLASPDEKLAVMVFGGFHKNRLQEILKRKHISCVTVSPKITAISETHQRYYQQLMSVGRLPFEPSSYVRTAAPAGRAVQVIRDPVAYLLALPDIEFPRYLKDAIRVEMREQWPEARSEIRTSQLRALSWALPFAAALTFLPGGGGVSQTPAVLAQEATKSAAKNRGWEEVRGELYDLNIFEQNMERADPDALIDRFEMDPMMHDRDAHQKILWKILVAKDPQKARQFGFRVFNRYRNDYFSRYSSFYKNSDTLSAVTEYLLDAAPDQVLVWLRGITEFNNKFQDSSLFQSLMDGMRERDPQGLRDMLVDRLANSYSSNFQGGHDSRDTYQSFLELAELKKIKNDPRVDFYVTLFKGDYEGVARLLDGLQMARAAFDGDNAALSRRAGHVLYLAGELSWSEASPYRSYYHPFKTFLMYAVAFGLSVVGAVVLIKRLASWWKGGTDSYKSFPVWVFLQTMRYAAVIPWVYPQKLMMRFYPSDRWKGGWDPRPVILSALAVAGKKATPEMKAPVMKELGIGLSAARYRFAPADEQKEIIFKSAVRAAGAMRITEATAELCILLGKSTFQKFGDVLSDALFKIGDRQGLFYAHLYRGDVQAAAQLIREVRPELVLAIASENPSIRQSAWQVLAALGKPNLEEVVALLKLLPSIEDEGERNLLISLLGRLRIPRAMSAMLPYWDDAGHVSGVLRQAGTNEALFYHDLFSGRARAAFRLPGAPEFWLRAAFHPKAAVANRAVAWISTDPVLQELISDIDDHHRTHPQGPMPLELVQRIEQSGIYLLPVYLNRLKKITANSMVYMEGPSHAAKVREQIHNLEILRIIGIRNKHTGDIVKDYLMLDSSVPTMAAKAAEVLGAVGEDLHVLDLIDQAKRKPSIADACERGMTALNKLPYARFLHALHKKDYEAAVAIPDAVKMAHRTVDERADPRLLQGAFDVIARLADPDSIEFLDGHISRKIIGYLKPDEWDVVKAIETLRHFPLLRSRVVLKNILALPRIPKALLLPAANTLVSIGAEGVLDDLAQVSFSTTQWSIRDFVILCTLVRGGHAAGKKRLVEFTDIVFFSEDGLDRELLEKMRVEMLIKAHENYPEIFRGEEIWEKLTVSGFLPVLVLVYHERPEFFNSHPVWVRQVKELVRNLHDKAYELPLDQRSVFLKEAENAIGSYVKKFNPESGGSGRARVYSDIAGFLAVVHDNLKWVLPAMVNMGLPVSSFTELRRALPLNNPLTRIIRVMGEPSSVVGGHLDVTNKIIQSGNMDQFMGLVLTVCRDRKRGAAQEVGGMLEVLRDEPQLVSWSAAEWERFGSEVADYYRSGFKVISPAFFNYFRAHRHDESVVRMMHEDMERELGNIAWGGFKGLTDEFKRKYGLTTADELALLGKYMTVANMTARDYVTPYTGVKEALQARGQIWTDEVDNVLRDLYSFGGSRTLLAYQPEAEQVMDTEASHARLVSYVSNVSASDLDASLQRFISGEEPQGSQDLKSSLVRTSMQRNGIDGSGFTAVPDTDHELQTWLSDWNAFFLDTFQQDTAEFLREKIRAWINNLSVNDLDVLMRSRRVPELISIREKKELFRPDSDMIGVMTQPDLSSEQVVENLAAIFLRKWIVQIRTEDIQDQDVFNAWIERGQVGFVKKWKKEIEKRGRQIESEVLARILPESLLAARRRFQESEGSKNDNERRRDMLTEILVSSVIGIFKPDRESIGLELRGFKQVEVPSEDNFYVGLFDDLLHLMGCMMSGVCTWAERPAQVRNPNFHFAKLAVKRPDGRLLGTSQVQLLRTNIRNRPHAQSEKGWRVLALPGINLDKTESAFTKERGVQALVETAQRAAEAAHLQGVVIPVDQNIRSNDPEINRIFDRWASRGWLKVEELDETIRLSSGLTYSSVYVVRIPQEAFILKPASLQAQVERQEALARSQMEETAVIFGEGLGEVVFPANAAAETKQNFEAAVGRKLADMPQKIVDIARNYVQSQEVVVRVVLDPGRESSGVNRTEEGLELVVGRDIVSPEGTVDEFTLGEMIAELLTALILHKDYDQLKELALFNETAYFKLANVKAILNHRGHLASYHRTMQGPRQGLANSLAEMSATERLAALTRHKADLDRYVDEAERIYQWNVFLSVMDDADPRLLVHNYIHILKNLGLLDDEDNIFALMKHFQGLDVKKFTSIAALRNAMKDFILSGTARLALAGLSESQIVEKEAFRHFDETQLYVEIKDTLLTTQSRNEFYPLVKDLIKTTLNPGDEFLDAEIMRLVDRDLFSAENREETIREVLQEILVRKIGNTAYTSLRSHLTAQRGEETIPYIARLDMDIETGTDADEYLSMEYRRGSDGEVNYELVFRARSNPDEDGEDAPPLHDEITELFPFPDDFEIGTGRRSELRRQNSRIEIDIKIIEAIPFEAVFSIKKSKLNRLAPEIWRELVALKGLNEKKLHLVIVDDVPGESPRLNALMQFRNTYVDHWPAFLSAGIPVIYFGDMNDGDGGVQVPTPVRAEKIRDYFDLYKGAFGTALLYLYHDGQLDGLSRNKQGYLHDPKGIYIGRVLAQIWRNNTVIASSA